MVQIVLVLSYIIFTFILNAPEDTLPKKYQQKNKDMDDYLDESIRQLHM